MLKLFVNEMRCLDCGCSLLGLEAHHCPGCGRWFDRRDPSTYSGKTLNGGNYLFRCLFAAIGMAISLLIFWFLMIADKVMDSYSPATIDWIWMTAAFALCILAPIAFFWSVALMVVGMQGASGKSFAVDGRRSLWIGASLVVTLVVMPIGTVPHGAVLTLISRGVF